MMVSSSGQGNMHRPTWLFIVAAFCVLATVSSDNLSSDTDALMAFIAPFGSSKVSWDPSTPTCNWSGIVCANNRVTEVRLPGVGLRGSVPSGTLGNLTALTTLSLRFNSLSGRFPDDIDNCVALSVVNVQNNMFSGELPLPLLTLPDITQINLAENRFSGTVPLVITQLVKLKMLYLEHNLLVGELPANAIFPSLTGFNVSFNNFTGEVPKGLSKQPVEAFLGTSLCGTPLLACNKNATVPSPAPSPSPWSAPDNGNDGKTNKLTHGLSGGAIAGIAIACAAGLVFLSFVLLLACRTSKEDSAGPARNSDAAAAELALRGKEAMASQNGGYLPREPQAKSHAVASPVRAAASPARRAASPASGGGKKKLIFFGRASRVYDLEDLLRASAEVLGKGTYGTTYKAVLEVGPTVVVKRLKETTLSEREFREKATAIGNVEHPNVVPLQAYYFSKDEKLLVYEFMAMGSLSSLLHGNRGSGRSPLNWEKRARIALSTARGLEYIHQTSPRAVHGSIKSSNVLLSRSHEARVSDHGLVQLVGPAGITPSRIAGYRAPEVVADPRNISQKADVYSFGVLLLELLTGKAPTHAVLHEDGIDLPRWARSVVKDEWTSEVFDPELLRYQSSEEEMVELLMIAMNCTVVVPEMRPTMPEVVIRIIELGVPASAVSMDRRRSSGSNEADDRPLKPTGSIRSQS